jgi:hypothetical protein
MRRVEKGIEVMAKTARRSGVRSRRGGWVNNRFVDS